MHNKNNKKYTYQNFLEIIKTLRERMAVPGTEYRPMKA